jgi:hypothetical protein
MFQKEIALARLPVQQGIEFIPALPSLEGCPPPISLPLFYDEVRPVVLKDIGDTLLQQRVLDYAPRACGGGGTLQSLFVLSNFSSDRRKGLSR